MHSVSSCKTGVGAEQEENGAGAADCIHRSQGPKKTGNAGGCYGGDAMNVRELDACKVRG